MKKLTNKSFWLILSTSLISLVVLIVGVVFLTRSSAKEFYSAGYIISSNQTKTEKYYFNNNTIYKENVFDNYVFKDVDNKEVTASKDNFIHYLDGSLSFMKSGVILDLDNLNTNLVPYYNITDKILIKYNAGQYYIEAADKTLIFKDILGRITDNKYIVAGSNIRIKLPGNNDLVKGEYFELLFVEDGIVKIENQEGSYQVTTENTVIYVGDNVKIDLGSKEVTFKDENKLSLSEITISGNENIDIKPNTGKVDKDKEENKPASENPATPNTPDKPNNGNGNETGAGSGNTGDSSADGKNEEPTSVLKKEVSVDLVTAKVGVNDLQASFQIIDTAEYIKGNIILTITNMLTGERVYTKLLANDPEIQNVNLSSLSPNCNYLMTIYEETESGSARQYFQKTFTTDSLDLKLVRDFVTTDSLSYHLDFGIDSEVKTATVTMYDEENNIINKYTITNGEDSSIVFSELESNKTYTVNVDEVVFNNTNYSSVYTISRSDITLKNKPVLGSIYVETDNEEGTFKLSTEGFIDEENSITRYIYKIYKVPAMLEEDTTFTDENLAYSFSADSLKEITLKVGENNLVGKQNYIYTVTAEYYDNYKYGELETGPSEYFIIVGKPTVEFKPENIEFNRIKGTITIKDESCTIALDGRECLDGANRFTVRYQGGTMTSKKILNGIEFTIDETHQNNLIATLDIGGLTESTAYSFEVYGNVDLHDGFGTRENVYIGSFTVATDGIDALQIENWQQNTWNKVDPINVSGFMTATNPEKNYGEKLSEMTINLYKGDVKNGFPSEPIATIKVTDDIQNIYFEKKFNIVASTFGIDSIDNLRELSGGKINRYYTIEITDAYDASGTNRFEIKNNKFVYETPSILLLEDELLSPEITVEEITNEEAPNFDIPKDKKLGDNIIVAYRVIALFDKNKIETYFQGNNPVIGLTFYALDSRGQTVKKITKDLIKEDSYEVIFTLGSGTEYDTIDEDMRRGNTYKFQYSISIDTNNDNEEDVTYPSKRPTSENMTSIKEDPKFYMYVDNSTENSITYKYKIDDYDNAIYKEEDKYYLTYEIDSETYTAEIVKDDKYNTVTLNNLKNSDIYTIKYDRANIKERSSNLVTLNKFFFDGYHSSDDYNLGYTLEYGNFDNRLKIILSDDEFFNRVSVYHLTLTAGTEKYELVTSKFTEKEECDEHKCLIIDYKDIAAFKGKNITVSLDAFYDTGLIGFSQPSRLEVYLKDLGLTTDGSIKVGYAYQNTSFTEPARYFYIDEKGAYQSSGNSPEGILGFELKTPENPKNITTVNLVNKKEEKFVPLGTIVKKDGTVILNNTSGIIEVSASPNKQTFNPKVLDITSIQTNDNHFKFTSITPKVSTTSSPLINGANMTINLSVDDDTLASDFVKTDGKYKFYIDIYSDEECTEESFVKTIETFYDELELVYFEGLSPDTTYYYKVSADMNKNGTVVKTPLFDYNKSGYIEYKSSFKTLGKEDIFRNLELNYNSAISEDKQIYNERKLTSVAVLKTSTNMDINFKLLDIEGNIEYEKTIPNSDITAGGSTFRAKYIEDITGDEFIFGNGYHTLIITALTTDLNLELELYNSVLNTTSSTNIVDIAELVVPIITVKAESIVSVDEREEYTYSINYNINVNDEDKVIKDGIYHIELQDAAYNNACKGHEEDCIREVDIKKQGFNINEVFTNLEPDTNYVIYIYADIYRNNLSLATKEEQVYVRKGQYTKNELNFSLGAVTPTAVAKNKLVITFAGAANLENSLKELDYNIAVQGGEKVASGTLIIGQNINFKKDKDGYPTLEINMPNGKELGLNNYIIITYRIEDSNGNLTELVINGKTNHQYNVKSA